MSSNAVTSYEDLPYDGHAFSVTHPGVLAVTAMLRGMSPASVETCRILELGCANGGNLIPMAYGLPNSRCVGIDLSPRQIAEGQAVVDTIGLRNISLQALSILDIEPDFGEFDYIICHGVFSWVPRVVQDKILDVCRANLAPNGVAYISYNTYPGWHQRGMVREMMNFHAQPFGSVEKRVQHSRAFLNLLVKIWQHRDPNNLYGRILQKEAEELENAKDTYLFHEHLEECNEPLYFHDFIAQAESHGLQYLWETKGSALARSLPQQDLQVLDSLSDDLIRQEQYFDFLQNRVFRRTILCRQEQPLLRQPTPTAVLGCQVTSRTKPLAELPNWDSLESEEFRTPDGVTLKTNRPLLKRMLGELFDWWPESISATDLWQAWQVDAERFPADWAESEPVQTFDEFCQELLQLYLSDVIELHSHVPSFTTIISERPQASSVARYEARRNLHVTNLRHFSVEAPDFMRLVLVRLDGTRTVDELLQSLISDVLEGRLSLKLPDSENIRLEAVRETLARALNSALEQLASLALLVS